MNKRGISYTLIASFVIIVSIFFIIFIWYFLFQAIKLNKDFSSQIDISYPSNDLIIISNSLQYKNNNLKFEIQKNPSDNILIGGEILIENGTDEYKYKIEKIPLDSQIEIIEVKMKDKLSNIKKISIIPIYQNSGEIVIQNNCGNFVIEPNLYEQCDDGNSLSLDGCDVDCLIESNFNCIGQPSICTSQICGNGIIEGNEECEGGNLNGETCQSLGLVSGAISCSFLCLYDISGCSVQPTCDNNLKEGTEICDGLNLNGQSFLSQGFSSGSLRCNLQCNG